MLNYMEYVARSFQNATNWNPSSNSYEYITETARSLIDFQIPDSFRFQLSNNSSNVSYNTLEVTTKQNNLQNKKVHGFLTYLYTNMENLHEIILSSSKINLQDATQTYKHIHPSYYKRRRGHNYFDNGIEKSKDNLSLYYGRMYYPSSDLEAMIIKRLNRNNQMTLKWLSSSAYNFNIMTLYWQNKSRQNRNFQEFIFSTNDYLCGYRILHNSLSTSSKFNNSLYNNSTLSIGAELWLSLKSMNPGCSTSLRYCTHSANTGRPLTLTVSYNPLFGHISSSYSAKTSLSSTFCTRYDFNIYSIESNLSFGWEFWGTGKQKESLLPPNTINNTSIVPNMAILNNVNGTIPNNISDDGIILDEHFSEGTRKSQILPTMELSPTTSESQQKLLQDLTYTFSSSLEKIDKEMTLIDKFQNKFEMTNFTSVWKFSTSLRDKNLKAKWEGKFRGFLVSIGTELFTTTPEPKTNSSKPAFKHENNNSVLPLHPAKFGIEIQYSS
ncbi:Mdm10p NDAI_0H02660 [Naumovozyma dairenensis CBS 421]|uniref:Mitochondrial distribution and morphology protein 10 n=1 Tax=Naumovozyma dairenensis (strain ATCC 10597 / BCRC 20456 / CBS 421 / NBRC 0211 / NRRL Y-12639) TaxID=1071378 RepID=G0WF79_NAUDC|nr:hypothetical protein NDAI_0H02660 [Naumovozyma dairenensis CBS 421]CCD26440.1 hypothetical protein NDAI_0H02660 [Naumovozyma dairenensis CBS 421]